MSMLRSFNKVGIEHGLRQPSHYELILQGA